MSKEPLFYFQQLEGELAGPYDLVQMAGLLRNGIIRAEVLTCLEGEEQWLPFNQRAEFAIVQEMPAGAVSLRTQKLSDAALEKQTPLFSPEMIAKLIGLAVLLGVAGPVVYFIAKSDPYVGLALVFLGSAASLIGTCLIFTRLVEEDFLTIVLVLVVPFWDIYYFLSNLEEYLPYFCAKYLGAALSTVALAGIAASTSSEAASVKSYLGL